MVKKKPCRLYTTDQLQEMARDKEMKLSTKRIKAPTRKSIGDPKGNRSGYAVEGLYNGNWELCEDIRLSHSNAIKAKASWKSANPRVTFRIRLYVRAE